MIGETFGIVTVVGDAGRTRSGVRLVLGRCACGTEKVLNSSNLKRGRTRSCGCQRRAVVSAKARAQMTIHGGSRTRSYASWSSMLRRCTDPRDRAFKDYGGRGIRVCERWHDFEAFFADMGERPRGMSIDRIDNEGNYVPGNCRWATPAEQRHNQRRVYAKA